MRTESITSCANDIRTNLWSSCPIPFIKTSISSRTIGIVSSYDNLIAISIYWWRITKVVTISASSNWCFISPWSSTRDKLIWKNVNSPNRRCKYRCACYNRLSVIRNRYWCSKRMTCACRISYISSNLCPSRSIPIIYSNYSIIITICS